MGKVKCPACEFVYSEFKKSGRFGCPECYAAFETQLIPLLRQVHGSTQHEGKTPKRLGPKAVIRKELMDLKEELSRAILDERYEDAATIRDRIRALETRVEEA
jgi:protein arginine kinase activator